MNYGPINNPDRFHHSERRYHETQFSGTAYGRVFSARCGR